MGRSLRERSERGEPAEGRSGIGLEARDGVRQNVRVGPVGPGAPDRPEMRSAPARHLQVTERRVLRQRP
jgi:hypothetical protein